MEVILDTNVILAAARSRRGAAAAVLSMVATGRFHLNLSVALALEYEEVLKRESEKLLMTQQEIEDLVAFLCANSTRREVHGSGFPLLNDPDDEFLARLAFAGACDHLITHNVRHLGELTAQGISVVTPREFLAIIKGNR
jgi:putative PIN family toxin of toxin-antitoxin system